MLTHEEIDDRLHRMVALCVAKIDRDMQLLGKVEANVRRVSDPRLRAEWESLLNLPWAQLREKLLAAGEAGNQLRQNAPLGGLLSNAERSRFFVAHRNLA